MPNCFWSPFRHLQSRPTHPNWLCIATDRKAHARDTLYTVPNQSNVTLIRTPKAYEPVNVPLLLTKRTRNAWSGSGSLGDSAGPWLLESGVYTMPSKKPDRLDCRLLIPGPIYSVTRNHSIGDAWTRIRIRSHARTVTRRSRSATNRMGRRGRRILDLEADPIKP